MNTLFHLCSSFNFLYAYNGPKYSCKHTEAFTTNICPLSVIAYPNSALLSSHRVQPQTVSSSNSSTVRYCQDFSQILFPHFTSFQWPIQRQFLVQRCSHDLIVCDLPIHCSRLLQPHLVHCRVSPETFVPRWICLTMSWYWLFENDTSLTERWVSFIFFW